MLISEPVMTQCSEATQCSDVEAASSLGIRNNLPSRLAETGPVPAASAAARPCTGQPAQCVTPLGPDCERLPPFQLRLRLHAQRAGNTRVVAINLEQLGSKYCLS